MTHIHASELGPISRPYADTTLKQDDLRREVTNLDLAYVKDLDLRNAGLALKMAAMDPSLSKSALEERMNEVSALQKTVGDLRIQKLLSLAAYLLAL